MRSRSRDTKLPNAAPSVSRNDGFENFMLFCVFAVQKKVETGCWRMSLESRICVEVKGLMWLRN